MNTHHTAPSTAFHSPLCSFPRPSIPLPTAPSSRSSFRHRAPPRCGASHHVKIFDTTLRDGLLLTPQALSLHQKLALAEQLARLGVDVIEAGFPALSSQNFAHTYQIAATIGRARDSPVIAALSKPSRRDVEQCFQAIHRATFPRLHIYTPTPPPSSLSQRVKQQLLHNVDDIISFATTLCPDIEFSPMNATSLFEHNPLFLRDIYAHAIRSGASTISVPDTSGKATSTLYTHLVRDLCTNVTGVDRVTISVHAHGPKEAAVINSIRAVKAGARQVECTVRGVGEGMAPLERVVHQLRHMDTDHDGHSWRVAVLDKEIEPTCRMVSQFMPMDATTT